MYGGTVAAEQSGTGQVGGFTACVNEGLVFFSRFLIAHHRTLLNANPNHRGFVSWWMLPYKIPPVSHWNPPRISHRIRNCRGRSHAIHFMFPRIKWQVRCRVVELRKRFRGKRTTHSWSMRLNSHWIARRRWRVIRNSFWAAIYSSTDTKISSLASSCLAAMKRCVNWSGAVGWRAFTVSPWQRRSLLNSLSCNSGIGIITSSLRSSFKLRCNPSDRIAPRLRTFPTWAVAFHSWRRHSRLRSRVWACACASAGHRSASYACSSICRTSHGGRWISWMRGVCAFISSLFEEAMLQSLVRRYSSFRIKFKHAQNKVLEF